MGETYQYAGEDIKLILEPPTLFNPIEIVYDDKGKILGCRNFGAIFLRCSSCALKTPPTPLGGFVGQVTLEVKGITEADYLTNSPYVYT